MNQNFVSYTIIQSFEDFVKFDNLYRSWQKFRRGKRERTDVIWFERHLEKELFELSRDLKNGTYTHSGYVQFYVHDPKFRPIHKAQVRDRIVHQALYDILYPMWERYFFFDSYSSRIGKGTQAAVRRIWQFIGQVSRNLRHEVYVFHGDVHNFFGSINHQKLLSILHKKIADPSYLKLCRTIIRGFNTASGVGIPLGNLTSQVFGNIYLHQLDYYIKQVLHIRRYVRYNDDFYIVADSKDELVRQAKIIQEFLHDTLHLLVPENKIIIKNLNEGVDILGVVAFPYGLVPRRRFRLAATAVIKTAGQEGYSSNVARQLNSYIGLLGDTNSYMLRERLRLSFSK